MPKTYLVHERPAGFLAENAGPGNDAKILVKATMTSDEPEFHAYIEEIMKSFLWQAQTPPDEINRFLVVFHENKSVDLFLNSELPVAAEVRTKRELAAGEMVTLGDISEVRRLVFPGVPLLTTDKVIFCGKFGWKFGLYIDLRHDEPLNVAQMSLELGALYRQLVFQHAYRSLESGAQYQAMLADGWFPFIEIISTEYPDLVNAYTDRFDFDNRIRRAADAFTRERLDSMSSRWWTNPRFAEKRLLLEAGVRAYLQRTDDGYIHCIKTLLTEVEGLLRLHYSADTGVTDGVRPHELAQHAADRAARVTGSQLSLLLPEPFRNYLTSVVYPRFNVGTGALAISRHTVGHGVAMASDYTQVRALQAILIVDQLAHLLNDLGKTSIVGPRRGDN